MAMLENDPIIPTRPGASRHRPEIQSPCSACKIPCSAITGEWPSRHSYRAENPPLELHFFARKKRKFPVIPCYRPGNREFRPQVTICDASTLRRNSAPKLLPLAPMHNAASARESTKTSLYRNEPDPNAA